MQPRAELDHDVVKSDAIMLLVTSTLQVRYKHSVLSNPESMNLLRCSIYGYMFVIVSMLQYLRPC